MLIAQGLFKAVPAAETEIGCGDIAPNRPSPDDLPDGLGRHQESLLRDTGCICAPIVRRPGGPGTRAFVSDFV